MFKAEFHDEDLLAVLHVSYRSLYNRMVERFMREIGDYSDAARKRASEFVDSQVIDLTKDYYYTLSKDNYPNYDKILGCSYVNNRLQVWTTTTEEKKEQKKKQDAEKRENRKVFLILGGAILGVLGIIEFGLSIIMGLFKGHINPWYEWLFLIICIFLAWLGFKKDKKKD